MTRRVTIACSILAALLPVASCSCEESVGLVVDLRTDFVAGEEFDAIRVVVDDASPIAAIVDRDADYLLGVRVAEIDGLAPGTHRVDLALVTDGTTVVRRPVVVELTARTGITVVITRDCRDVACSDDSQACLAAACVDARCTPETPELCPSPECTAASECTEATAACAAPSCSDGRCLYGDDGTCAAVEYCDPDRGCRARRTAPSDAGPDADADADADAGPPAPPLRVSSDPRWLEVGGQTIFLAGVSDDEDFLYRGTRNADGTRDGDQLALIATAAASGINAMFVIAVGSHGGDLGPDANPFIGSDETMGVDLDILDQWETWVAAANAAGIVIVFGFYDDDTDLFATGDVIPPEEDEMLRAIVDRLETYPLVFWFVREIYQRKISDARAIALIQTIADADDFDHPIGLGRPAEIAIAPTTPELTAYFFNSINETGLAIRAGILPHESGLARPAPIFVESNNQLAMGGSLVDDLFITATSGAQIVTDRWAIATASPAELESFGLVAQFMSSVDLRGMRADDGRMLGGTQSLLVSDTAFVAWGDDTVTGMGASGMTDGTYELRWLDPSTRMETAAMTSSVGGDVVGSGPGIGPGAVLAARRTGPP